MTSSADLPDTLVLDIGKSNAKLVVIDAAGQVRARRQQANASVDVPELGVRALGVAALEAWLRRDIPALARDAAIGRIAISTHGAAFCALAEQGLAFPPLDYEWDGYGRFADQVQGEFDGFAHTGSPRLPQGLNAGLQLAWVHRHHPEIAARIRHWLPYPQYWAWWLTGVLASEVSSLACHTGLWSPGQARFSDWARAQGLARLFPPLQPAHATLGRVRPEQALALGLSPATEVIVGVHDSNACLARYLHSLPDAVVVSSGTWCVLMAPGGRLDGLDAARDELVNVAVDGQAVPTARFMGGREFAALCGGADPALATEAALAQLLDAGWMAHPAFAPSGGPWCERTGTVSRHGAHSSGGVDEVPPILRPALAALYCAEVTAHLIERLSAGGRATSPVVLEGPLAGNAAWRAALGSLLPGRALWAADDDLEGTARGAWMLSRWEQAAMQGAGTRLVALPVPDAALAERLRGHAQAWNAALGPAPVSRMPDRPVASV